MRKTLLFLFLIAMFASIAEAKHYSHPKIEQDITLRLDGSAVVEEIRTFDFSGQFGRAYVDRMPTGQYGDYRITYEGVWDDDSGKQLEWLQSVNEDYTRIAWRYSANDEIKRFRLRYRIEWAVQKYHDVGQFYWKCIEDDHAAIDSVILKITLPEKPPTLFAAFVHTRSSSGERIFSTDSSSVTLRVGYVPEKSFVEARVLTDAELFPDAATLVGEDRASLLDAERKILEPTLLEWASRYAAQVLSILFFVVLALFGLALYLIYGREPEIEEGKYLRQPPSDIPPCMVPAIMTQEDITMKTMVNGFSAALLECSRLGYVEINHNTGKAGESEFILTEKGEQIVKREPADLGEGTISQFEHRVLKIVFGEAEVGAKISSSGLKAWAATPTGTSNAIRSFLSSWGTSMRVWFEKEKFELDDQESSAISHGLPTGAIIIAFVTFVLLIVSEQPISFAYLMPVAIAFTGWKLAPALAKRTQQGAREVHRWEAFRNFLTDFSNLENASEKMLPMWDKYLVYATALGVASEFSAQLRKAAMQMPNADWQMGGHNTWVPSWYHMGHMGSGSDFQLSDVTSSLSTTLNNAVSDFSSMTRDFRNTTSGSGWNFGGGGSGFGGGFSGGGGGGGGGGGSGAS